METVFFEDVRRKRFLEALKKGAPTEKRAALQSKVAFSEVKVWLRDPDFGIAVTAAKEEFGEVEQERLDRIEGIVYAAAEEGSDVRLSMDVLKTRRGEKWNPSVKVDIVGIRHRFIDFSGQPLHEALIEDETDLESGD